MLSKEMENELNVQINKLWYDYARFAVLYSFHGERPRSEILDLKIREPS